MEENSTFYEEGSAKEGSVKEVEPVRYRYDGTPYTHAPYSVPANNPYSTQAPNYLTNPENPHAVQPANVASTRVYSVPAAPEVSVESAPSIPSAPANVATATHVATATSSEAETAATSHVAAAASTQPAHAATVQPVDTSRAAAKSHKGGGLKTFCLGFLGAALACALFYFGVPAIMNALPNDAAGGSDIQSGQSTILGDSTNSTTIRVSGEDVTLAEAVAEKCLPSVVNIDVYTNQTSRYGFGYGYSSGYGFRDSDESSLELSSLGSGVVISEDGYVLTNYHVVEGADALVVTVEGETYDADVVGYDDSSDIAVIKLQDASGLTPIEIGDSDALIIGEWVMTLGSPFGLEQSVATGIVSATSRSTILDSSSGGQSSIYTNLIQTDAAINPGNSGGALVNKQGQLIGINTLISSNSGSYAGVGFAIPVNYAYRLAQQIIAGETPSHAQIGVTMSSVTSSSAQRNGLSATSGAYVSSVAEGSGAAAAGIQEGDIIVKLDNSKIESASDLLLAVRSHDPGDVVTVVVNRNGTEMELEVTLGSDTD